MKLSRKVLLCELKEVLIYSGIGILFNLMLYDITVGNLVVSSMVWVFLAKGNGYIVDFLNVKISWVERPILRVVVGMIAMMAYTILAFGGIVIGARWAIDGIDPIRLLQALEPDDFTVALLITLIISMFFHGRAFYINWKQALFREERLKNETLKSQYESLKNQVNPHFLFNSLNVLSGLVYDDQKKAVEFIRKMSDVYRYVLEKKDQELVTLEEELGFLRSYVYLQQIRFGDNFKINIRENGKGHVPPMALQLLIENAIKHNVVSEARPLSVNVEITGDHVIIENNIQEKKTKDSTGVGLSNLKARYGYLSDRPVEIYNDHQTFRITLPILQLEK